MQAFQGWDLKEVVRKVRQLEVRSRKKSEAAHLGQYYSRFRGQGMTFSEVRPYQFGDDVRRMDWNKTARFREPFVKVVEEEREHNLILLVDVSSSMDFGTRYSLKREYVAEIVASLAFSAQGQGDRVGAVLFADQIIQIIPPDKGRKHLLSMLSKILSCPSVPARTDFSKVFQTVYRVFRRRASVFLFSDFYDIPPLQGLQVFSLQHQVVGLQLNDRLEIAMPDIGFLPLEDTEFGQRLWADTSSKFWREQYSARFSLHQEELKKTFSHTQAHLLSLTQQDDYAKSLVKYFKK